MGPLEQKSAVVWVFESRSALKIFTQIMNYESLVLAVLYVKILRPNTDCNDLDFLTMFC